MQYTHSSGLVLAALFMSVVFVIFIRGEQAMRRHNAHLRAMIDDFSYSTKLTMEDTSRGTWDMDDFDPTNKEGE